VGDVYFRILFELSLLIDKALSFLGVQSLVRKESSGFRSFLDYKLGEVDNKPITLSKILVSLMFLAAGIWLSKVVIRIIRNKFLSKFVENESAAHAIENISFYFMVTFFALVSLQVANIPITVFTFVGGAFALAFGLGAQNLANNFVSGIILLIERPVKIGDFVQVGDVYGRVEDIGMRATKINSLYNVHLIVPNAKLAQDNVKNLTHNSKRVKSEIKVGVRYGSDAELVKKLLLETAKENVATLKSREPTVLFEGFGDSALEFTLLFDIKLNSLMDMRLVNSAIRYAINLKFKENNVIVAFPQRDVHVHLPEELTEKFKKVS